MKLKLFLLLFTTTFLFVGCKKDDEPSSNDCNDQLKTEVRCQATLPACDGEQLSQSVQCLAKTTTGSRCNHKTLNKCGYCSQVPSHKDQWDGTCPNMTKNACKYCDDHKHLKQE